MFSTIYDDTRGIPVKFGINVKKLATNIFLTSQGIYSIILDR
jgi:hypothetical protein